MRKVLLTLVMVLVVAGAVTQAAVTDTKTIAVSATVAATAKLTLGQTTLTFPNSDPDTVPSIAATEGGVTVKAQAKTTAAGNVTLTVKAGGALTSAGGDTIALTNLTWTTAGDAGYDASGTMNTTNQSVGSWTGSGERNGTQTYALANSWSYATGTYTATLTYTLTAP